MDLTFDHPSDIFALRPCHNDDATDLVAVGGEQTVQVIQVVSNKNLPFYTFY